jgi:hypothetical protein
VFICEGGRLDHALISSRGERGRGSGRVEQVGLRDLPYVPAGRTREPPELTSPGRFLEQGHGRRGTLRAVHRTAQLEFWSEFRHEATTGRDS